MMNINFDKQTFENENIENVDSSFLSPSGYFQSEDSDNENNEKSKQRKPIRTRRNSICSLPVSTVSVFSAFSFPNVAAAKPPKRSQLQLLFNSSIMFGREFCYAVEAGLTTPILLSIGLPVHMYSLVWVISPILGFILQPVFGNISDRCSCRWGKRRPFILGLALLLLVGLTLLLNGEDFVRWIDNRNTGRRSTNISQMYKNEYIYTRTTVLASIMITIAGVVLFDFSADFIEGPIRAYAMDVCDEEDVKKCLLYQAVFTGAGGAFGYASAGVSWTRDTILKPFFSSDRQVVYTASAIIFITCCVFNLLSVSEQSCVQSKSRDEPANVEINQTYQRQNNSQVTGSSQKIIGQEPDHVYADNIKRSNLQTESSAETEILQILMKQNRDRLFEQYENYNCDLKLSNSPSVKADATKHLRTLLDGKVIKQTKKFASSSGKIFKKKGIEKLNPVKLKAIKNNVLISEMEPRMKTYGTFITDNQSRYDNFYNQVSADEPQSFFLYNHFPTHLFSHLNENSVFKKTTAKKYASLHYSRGLENFNIKNYQDVIEARAIFPSAFTKFSQTQFLEETCSSDSEDFDSSSSLIHRTKLISDHGDVDPKSKHLQHSYIITNKEMQLSESNGLKEDLRNTLLKTVPDNYDYERIHVFSDVLVEDNQGQHSHSDIDCTLSDEIQPQSKGLKGLVGSIVSMPKELRYLCVCHLFGWIAFLSMALFFTDFVGQVVMQGDPRAPLSARKGDLYHRGVEIGNWGLTINAAASSVYCVILKPLIRKFGCRRMYVFGYTAFGIGSLFIALFPTTKVVLTLSSSIGIISATLYTIPYMLVAQYHETYKNEEENAIKRGIGTDCALVTCMIQLAQIIVGLGVGALVNLTGTVTVTVATSSVFAIVGAIWACFFVEC